MRTVGAWQFYIALDRSPPRLLMRRKVAGRWEYREPTADEQKEYRAIEAW